MDPAVWGEVQPGKVLDRQLRQVLVGVYDGARARLLAQDDAGAGRLTPLAHHHLRCVHPIFGKVVQQKTEGEGEREEGRRESEDGRK